MNDDEKTVSNQIDAHNMMGEGKEHIHPLAAAESEKTDESMLNAALVIERFGGIRPMATKTNIAATTIQGWKQRGVIPNVRRQEIIEAAQLYEIDIEDLLKAVEEGGKIQDVDEDSVRIGVAESQTNAAYEPQAHAQAQAKMQESSNQFQAKTPPKEDEFRPKKSRYQDADFGPGADASIAQIHDHNRKQFERMNGQSSGGMWFAVILIFLCVLGVAGYVLLSPKVKNIDVQQQKIAELEQEVEKLRVQNSRVLLQRQEGPSQDGSGTAGAVLGSTLSELQNKVSELSDQAKNYSQTIEDFKNGSVNERLQSVEQSIQGLADHTRALGLQGFLYRLQNLQSSAQGQEIVEQWMSSIAGMTLGTDTVQGETQAANKESPDFDAALTQLQMSDPQFAETFRDVAPEDIKAAIMLMAMAQLRNSLERDRTSFDQDLNILKLTLARDNPELAKSIDQLAPKAKSGVLTPQGLSKEFRAMSGEIIADSLAGKDVSVKDKAIARLGDLVKVEKNGAQISGTRAQIQVAEAQKLLDQGDIAGAMAILQETQAEQGTAQEGNSAGNDRINAFLSEAQATLAAQNLRQNLQNKVSLQLKSMISAARPGGYTGGRGAGGSAGGEYMVKPGVLNGGNFLPPELKSLLPSAPEPSPPAAPLLPSPIGGGNP